MFVPRHLTKPIFYPDPDALQMFFDFPITKSMTAICKAVLLLTTFIKYLLYIWVFGRLPGLITLSVLCGRDSFRPSTRTFKLGHKRQFVPGLLKKSTIVNTDGWGNKLVAIFARHLDSFIMTQ